MKKYWDIDLERIWTEDELHAQYDKAKSDGSIPHITNFADFLRHCMVENNGSLKEVTDDDLRWITVDTVYYGPGPFGKIQHRGRHYFERLFRVKEIYANGKEVDFTGVNFIIVNEDDNRIFQASGYTYDRGLFCDLY